MLVATYVHGWLHWGYIGKIELSLILTAVKFSSLLVYNHKGRAVAIRFGAVRLVVHAQERYTLGGPGGMLPQKNFLNLRAMRLLLRPFLGQYDASRRPDDRVSHDAILLTALYSAGVGFPIQFAYQPKATPFTGEVCETNRSLVRRLLQTHVT